MTSWLYFVAAAFAFISIAIMVVEFTGTFSAVRASRELTCPADGRTATVDVNAVRAALPTAVGYAPKLRVQNCSRWPERKDCQQACLGELRQALTS